MGLILSSNKDNDRYERYRQSALLGLRFLMQMQYTKNNSYDELSIGGFQFSPFNKEIRIDVVQHAVFAMNNILTVF